MFRQQSVKVVRSHKKGANSLLEAWIVSAMLNLLISTISAVR